MSLFHFKHKQKLLIKDPYFVRFELADSFTPENNHEIQEILEELSNEEQQTNQPPLLDTLPFASFATAEAFFGRLRELAAKNATPVDFAYFAIWKYNDDEKIKMGQKGSGKGNPHEFITLNRTGHSFKISSEYENMTIQLFEEIFNDPDNVDISYEDKIDYCNTLKESYLASTNLSEDEIAELPSVDEVQSGPVTLHIPALTKSPASQQPQTVYDPSTHTFSSSDQGTANDGPAQATNNQVSTNPVPAPQPAPQVTVNNDGVRTLDTPTAPEPKETANNHQKVPRERVRRTIRKSVEDEAKEQTTLAQAKGYVEAPQFTTKELDPVEAGHAGYVEYTINQQMKSFNKILQNIAKQVSSKNEKAIIQSRQNFSHLVDQAVQDFKKKHAHDEDNIFADIQKEMKSKKDAEFGQAKQEIDIKRQNQLDKAEVEYNQMVNDINHQAKTDTQKADSELLEKYTARAEELFTQKLAEHTDKLNKTQDELVHKLTLKFELESREQAAQLRSEGDKVLQEAFSKMTDKLDQLKVSSMKEDNSAKELNISNQRVENEKKRLEAPFEDVRNANKQVADLQNQLGTATADSNHYKQIVADQEATLHENKATIESLRDQLHALSTQKSNEKVNQSNQDSAELMNKFLTLAITKQLGLNNDDNQQSAEPKNNEDNNDHDDAQVSTMIKGVKRMMFSFITVLVLVLLGGGLAFVHQQHSYEQRLDHNTKVMNAKLAQAKQKQGTPRISQAEANRKALVALHENSKSKLNKYSNEKYYDLDKAIIDNDSAAVSKAVQAMGSDLEMNDHYRAAQAQNLLQKYGNYDLANAVSDAN